MFKMIRQWMNGSSAAVDSAEATVDAALEQFASGVREDLVEARARFRDRLGLNIELDEPEAISDRKAGKGRGK